MHCCGRERHDAGGGGQQDPQGEFCFFAAAPAPFESDSLLVCVLFGFAAQPQSGVGQGRLAEAAGPPRGRASGQGRRHRRAQSNSFALCGVHLSRSLAPPDTQPNCAAVAHSIVKRTHSCCCQAKCH